MKRGSVAERLASLAALSAHMHYGTLTVLTNRLNFILAGNH